jgi:hypothetical protein
MMRCRDDLSGKAPENPAVFSCARFYGDGRPADKERDAINTERAGAWATTAAACAWL